MKFGMLKRAAAVAAALAVSASMTACVNQHPEETTAGSVQTTAVEETSAAGTDASGDGTSASEAETAVDASEERVVATTPSIMKICDMLEIDLVGIPDTSGTIPERYANATKVGMAMSPDLEIISSLDPTVC